jgi:Icc-related predicted phosphoesterase
VPKFENPKSIIRNAVLMNNSGVRIGGVNIYGFPSHLKTDGDGGVPTAFQLSEEELAPIHARIPADTHVLVTHAGLAGILDYSTFKKGAHLGSQTLRERIKQLHYLLFSVHGHVHAATEPQPKGYPNDFESVFGI